MGDVSKSKIYLAKSGTNINETSEDDMQNIAMFTFTSFLLGKEDYAYFYFGNAPGAYQHFAYFDYWETDIGKPLEDYHLMGNIDGSNIYEREYENVLILVNPSDNTENIIIDLDKKYKLLNGNAVNYVCLGSKQGIILLKIRRKS